MKINECSSTFMQNSRHVNDIITENETNSIEKKSILKTCNWFRRHSDHWEEAFITHRLTYLPPDTAKFASTLYAWNIYAFTQLSLISALPKLVAIVLLADPRMRLVFARSNYYEKAVMDGDVRGVRSRLQCYTQRSKSCCKLTAFLHVRSLLFTLTLILRHSRTGTVWFYTSTNNKRAARPKLYTKSLTRDLKLMYSRLTLVRISINH